MAPALSILVARNDVLDINPPPTGADIHITSRGSDWLWTVTAIDFFSLIAILALLYITPRTDRIFHYISVLTIIVTGIAYFTLASDLGSQAIPVEFKRSDDDVAGTERQVFWIRYVDWFFTGPLILLNVLLTAGVYWHTILYSILLYIVYVILLFVGSLVPTTYKWGYFTLAVVALALVLENIAWAGWRHASAIGGNISRLYLVVGPSLLLLWILYPVAWGVADGGNVIAPDSEQIFYGILDVLTKPVLAFVILIGHRSIDISQLDLRLYDRVPNEADANRTAAYNEKREHLAGDAAAEASGSVPAPEPAANGSQV